MSGSGKTTLANPAFTARESRGRDAGICGRLAASLYRGCDWITVISHTTTGTAAGRSRLVPSGVGRAAGKPVLR